MNQLGKPHGALGVSPYNGIISPAYFVARIRTNADSRFVHHLLRTRLYISEYERRGKYMPPSQFDISWNQFRAIPVALPSIIEQQAIADFLDAETARIDALTAKKRRMIELLKERFRGAIDKSVRGEWPMVSLKWCMGRIADGTHGTFERIDTGVPLLSAKNLRHGRVQVTEEESLISEEDYADIIRSRRFQPNDVLLGVIGGSIGNVAQLRPSDPRAFQRSVAALSPSPRYRAEFLYFVAQSKLFQEQLHLAANTSAQAGVYLEDLGSVRVPLPSPDTQKKIAGKLRQEADSTSMLADRLQRAIELLIERRQALITAAVTGQLKVPGVVA